MRLLWFNLATDKEDPILGFTSTWLSAAARLVESIDVITMRQGKVDLPPNVRVHTVGKELGYSEARRAIEFYRQLIPLLGKVDACFSHMMPLFSAMGGPLLKLRGIPLVTWFAHKHVSPTLKIAHHLSDRMTTIVPSAYRYRHDKLITLGHGIDTEFFRPSPSKSSSDLILSVGRLSPIKDLVTLITAVRLLRDRQFNPRLSLIGDAPGHDRTYAQLLREKTRALGLEEAVDFIGSVTNPETLDWYRRGACHVNLCPPGAPDKAALEAMACGIPSLVANREGFADTLGRWADILCFEHGSASDLATKLSVVLSQSTETRNAMVTELRQAVVQKHRLERLAGNVVSILEELVAARAANAPWRPVKNKVNTR